MVTIDTFGGVNAFNWIIVANGNQRILIATVVGIMVIRIIRRTRAFLLLEVTFPDIIPLSLSFGFHDFAAGTLALAFDGLPNSLAFSLV